MFVAVMAMAAERSVPSYGERASMHGVNMVFLAMTVFGIGMFLLAVIGIGTQNVKNMADEQNRIGEREGEGDI